MRTLSNTAKSDKRSFRTKDSPTFQMVSGEPLNVIKPSGKRHVERSLRAVSSANEIVTYSGVGFVNIGIHFDLWLAHSRRRPCSRTLASFCR